MPSFTLSPVSLNDRTGALSLTVPTLGVVWAGTEGPQFLPAGAEPVLVHDTEKKSSGQHHDVMQILLLTKQHVGGFHGIPFTIKKHTCFIFVNWKEALI
jgi:hypothetical protein